MNIWKHKKEVNRRRQSFRKRRLFRKKKFAPPEFIKENFPETPPFLSMLRRDYRLVDDNPNIMWYERKDEQT